MWLPGAVEIFAVLILFAGLTPSRQQGFSSGSSQGAPPSHWSLQREPVECYNDVIVFNVTGNGDDESRATCVKPKYAVDFCCPKGTCQQRSDCSEVVLQDGYARALDSCWLKNSCIYRTCRSFQPKCVPMNNLLDFTSVRSITEATSVLRLQKTKAEWQRQSYVCGIRSVFGWSVPVRVTLIRMDDPGAGMGEEACAQLRVTGDTRLGCRTPYVGVTKATPFNVTVDVGGLKPIDVDVYALLISDRGDVEVKCHGAVPTVPPATTTPNPGSNSAASRSTSPKTGGGFVPPSSTPLPHIPTSPVPTSNTTRGKGGNPGSKDDQSSMDSLPIFIVAAVVLVIALIVATIVVCMLKRKGVVCRSKGTNSGGSSMSRAGESGLHLQPTSSQPQESIYYSVDDDHSFPNRAATPQYDAVEWSMPTATGRSAGNMYFRLRTDDPTPPTVGEGDSTYFIVESDHGTSPATLPVGYRRPPNVVQPGGKGPYAVTQLPRDPASFHGDLGGGFQGRVPGFSSLGRGGGPTTFIPIEPAEPPLPCRGPPEFSSRHYSEQSEDPYHSIRDSDIGDPPHPTHASFHRQDGRDRQRETPRATDYDGETGFGREVGPEGSSLFDRRDGGRQGDYDRQRGYSREPSQGRPSTFGRHIDHGRRGDYDRPTGFDRPTDRAGEDGRRPSANAKPSSGHEGDRGYGNGVFSPSMRSPSYEPQGPRHVSNAAPPVPAARTDPSVEFKRGR